MNMQRDDRFFRATLATCLFGAAALVGCDSDSGGSTSVPGLEVHLYGPNGAADPFAGVGWIRIIMTGDGLVAPYTRTVAYAPGGTGSLDGVPFSNAGQARKLVIEGWSDAGGTPGFVVARGRAASLEVAVGKPVKELDVLFARVNSFLPLISTSTKAPQQLANARVGHAVTKTIREIVITGGGTITNSASTWWNGLGFQSIGNSVEAVSLDTRELGSRTAMIFPRTWHTATALSSGQVIIAGGYGADGNPTDTAELYSPPGVLGGQAAQLPKMAVARAGHTATLLDEATRVMLFVGGDELGTWELWDPVAGSIGGAKPLPDNLARRHHQATTFFLPGRGEPAVLITGGESPSFVHATAMLYDSVARALIPVSKALPGGARTQHTAVYVPARDYIYVAGGFTDTQRKGTLAAIDVFEIGKTAFKEDNGGFRMRTPRGGHQATLLADNLVCMAGGMGEEPPGTGLRPLGSLEVIHEFIDASSAPPSLRIEVASSWNPNGVGQVPYLPTDRIGHRIVDLDGMALVVGGAAIENGAGGFKMVKDLSLFNPQ